MAQEAVQTRVSAAQIHVTAKGDTRGIRISNLGGKVSAADYRAVNDRLVEVIKGLTGCPCGSGLIDVLFERDFERVIDVQIGH